MKAKRWMLSGALVLAGCVAAPIDSTPPAGAPPSLRVAPDTAALFIIRAERTAGAIALDVLIDGKVIGATVSKSYLYTVLTPGRHLVGSRGDITHTLEVDLAAGTTTYLGQEVMLSYLSSPRTRLRVMDESVARKTLSELKPAPTR